MHETSTYKTFCHTIFCNNLIRPHDTVVVALSGGVDSVTLLHFLNLYKEKENFILTACHLVHGWEDRKQEEEKEKELCQKICASLGVSLTIKYAEDVMVPAHKLKRARGSREAHAREIRQTFFRSFVSDSSVKIALGHHQDDDIETVFIRLIRGCSVQGAAGIMHASFPLIHPLLDCKKDDLVSIARAMKWDYHNDCSNAEEKGLRNKLRNVVFPVLDTVDSRWKSSMYQNVIRFKQALHYLAGEAARIFSELYKNHSLSISKLQLLDPIMQEEISCLILLEEKIEGPISQNNINELLRFLSQHKSREHRIRNVHLKKCSGDVVVFSSC